jgi:DNA-binding NtrC family response regulator
VQLPTRYPQSHPGEDEPTDPLDHKKEQPEGLSSRKLIVETAKYNALTAFSAKEGLEIFKEHPVNAVVLHSSVQGIPCDSMVKQIKKQQPDMPVIILSATGLDQCSRQTRPTLQSLLAT